MRLRLWPDGGNLCVITRHDCTNDDCAKTVTCAADTPHARGGRIARCERGRATCTPSPEKVRQSGYLAQESRQIDHLLPPDPRVWTGFQRRRLR